MKGERGLWQRRFWEHTIRDVRNFARHVDYVHSNPVKHRHCQRASDWPHSSFHRFVRLGLLSEDWAGTSACLAEHEADFGETQLRD